MMVAAVRYMCCCAASGADSDDTLWLENARMATPEKPDPASSKPNFWAFPKPIYRRLKPVRVASHRRLLLIRYVFGLG